MCVQHEDIGQMNIYLGYFAKEKNMPDDNLPDKALLQAKVKEWINEYNEANPEDNMQTTNTVSPS